MPGLITESLYTRLIGTAKRPSSLAALLSLSSSFLTAVCLPTTTSSIHIPSINDTRDNLYIYSTPCRRCTRLYHIVSKTPTSQIQLVAYIFDLIRCENFLTSHRVQNTDVFNIDAYSGTTPSNQINAPQQMTLYPLLDFFFLPFTLAVCGGVDTTSMDPPAASDSMPDPDAIFCCASRKNITSLT